MKADRHERNHALAAEYVLGTLTGAARRRFETWMLESPRVRRQVWYWERRFQALNGAIPERRPPAVVWRKVRGRIDRPGSGARNLWWPVGGLLAASLVIALGSEENGLFLGILPMHKGRLFCKGIQLCQ